MDKSGQVIQRFAFLKWSGQLYLAIISTSGKCSTSSRIIVMLMLFYTVKFTLDLGNTSLKVLTW